MKKSNSNSKNRFLRLAGFLALALGLACLVLAGGSALYNRSLPRASSVIDRISAGDQARLAEATHLRQTLGGQVWPRWESAEIPVILYTEEYAMLADYPNPPAGWVREPHPGLKGKAWELVPGETYQGQVYYRQAVSDASQHIGAFTVRVGDRWVTSFPTKEYGEVSFVTGFGQELPPVVREVFPYRLFYAKLGGESEAYMAGLLHESFHAYQGSVVPERLRRAEKLAPLEDQYPWDDAEFMDAWRVEAGLLAGASGLSSRTEALDLARRFLAQRDLRRQGLDPEFVNYEREREWLEGMATYVALEITRLAEVDDTYEPAPEISADPDFHQYRGRENFWQMQSRSVTDMVDRKGEILFYYAGLNEALLLDWLLPDWQTRLLLEDLAPEDLLREALE